MPEDTANILLISSRIEPADEPTRQAIREITYELIGQGEDLTP